MGTRDWSVASRHPVRGLWWGLVLSAGLVGGTVVLLAALQGPDPAALPAAIAPEFLGTASTGATPPAQIAHSEETPSLSLVMPMAGRLRPTEPPPAVRARVLETYGKIPLQFEANQGQAEAPVAFLARGPGYTVFLTPTEAVLALRPPSPGGLATGNRLPGHGQAVDPVGPQILRMELVGVNSSPEITGRDQLPGKVNYFRGQDPTGWRTNISTYQRVHFRDVYPGIDLVYYGNQHQLEHDFIVDPGADPSAIRLRFTGAESLDITVEGDLLLTLPGGTVRLHTPIIYQKVHGTHHAIAGRYVQTGIDQVGFQVAAYDADKPLVIDPVLAYSTYLGGTGNDVGYAIAVDADGNAYIAGSTYSTDFPTTPGVFDPSFNGTGYSQDVFVTKLNPTGTALVYSTYLGGTGYDDAHAIAVDADGNALVTGFPSEGFPLTPGAVQTSGGLFLTKLNPTGTALVYSTRLGGSSTGIAVDASGNAYVTGSPFGDYTFVTTPGAFQTSGAGSFVTKVNPTGTALVYSTVLWGSSGGGTRSIAVDAAGNAYVTGTASSDFPTTPGAFQTTGQGAFLMKVNPTGTALVYSTIIGGWDGIGVAVDANGDAYVTGRVFDPGFPTTPGAYDTSRTGTGSRTFVTKVNSTGTGLLYSTFLGGSVQSNPTGLAVDSAGNAFVFVAGSAGFPTTPDSFGRPGAGPGCFAVKLNPSGTALVYSTYVGYIVCHAIAVDPAGSAYMTAHATSSDLPMTAGALRPVNLGGGAYDTIVAKISTPPGDSLVVSLTSSTTAGQPAVAVNTPGTLQAFATGSVGGPINFTFWWNCNDPSTSVTLVTAICGDPTNPGIGATFTGVTQPVESVGHPYATVGTYTAKVIAERGGLLAEGRATITVKSAEVTIAATTPTAIEAGPTNGIFTVTRMGDTTASLTVSYIVGGTATPGVQYLPLPGSVTIPAGATTAPILVTPIENHLAEGDQTVTVSLTGDPAYIVDYLGSATVTIIDSDVGLTVVKGGNGDGTVTSNPAGILCGTACNAGFSYNTPVTLTAIPVVGAIFSGWSGEGCSGVGTCMVIMSRARNVMATFTLQTFTLSVSAAGNGSGTVSPVAVESSAPYYYGTPVTLTATPATGSTFTGWSGEGCSGTGTCIVSMTQARSVTATFALQTFTLSVSAAGNGSGTVSPVAVGSSATYNYGASIILTATPATNSLFDHWEGDCTGTTPSCTVSVTQPRAVMAVFAAARRLTVTTSGPGSGTVTSDPPGIACGTDCTEAYVYGEAVTLTATPAVGSAFDRWAGNCTGTTPICILSLSQDQSVTAVFTPAPPSLSLSLNQTTFHSGGSLILSVAVTPGATPQAVDAYVAVALPNGTLLFLQGDGSLTSEVRPFVTNWTATSLTAQIFAYRFGGAEPPGFYNWYAAFTVPGGNPLFGTLGPIVSATFSFSP